MPCRANVIDLRRRYAFRVSVEEAAEGDDLRTAFVMGLRSEVLSGQHALVLSAAIPEAGGPSWEGRLKPGDVLIVDALDEKGESTQRRRWRFREVVELPCDLDAASGDLELHRLALLHAVDADRFAQSVYRTERSSSFCP